MYGFIIDTDSYSGNFERELCAYVTGHIGDCGTGDTEAEEYLKQFEKVKGVVQREDAEQHSIFRPVEICPTPGIWNNGLGFHFAEGQEALALEKYKEYHSDYKKKNIAVVEGHRGKNIHNWTNEAIDQAIQRYTQEIEEVLSQTEVNKYPAFQSVFIHFDSIPDEETVEFMKKRAFEYAKANNLVITGFRISERKTYPL